MSPPKSFFQRNKSISITICLQLFLVVFFLTMLDAWPGVKVSKVKSGLTTGGNGEKTIVHIVMFEFKADARPNDIQAACDRMLSLKDNCLHPLTQKPYLKSVVGGKDDSSEGLQDGITHAFVVNFDKEEDRQYYLDTDPAHQVFKKSIGDVVQKAQVVDFVPGFF